MIMPTSLLSCDIEKIAEDIIRDYYGKNAFELYPIDICKMASDYFNLIVIYESLSDDEDVLGVTAYQSTQVKLRRGGRFEVVSLPKGTVLIEQKLRQGKNNLGRLRFTLAHECSHHVLFSLCSPQVDYSFRKKFEEGRAYTVNQIGNMTHWSERKANELAASLLMPIPMLDKLVTAFDIQKIKIYGDEKIVLKDRQTIEKAAHYIGVSKQAMLIRLKQLKYLETLPDNEFPLTFGINIWKE